MEVPVVALATRMTRWAVGGRRSHTFVPFLCLTLGNNNVTERFCSVQPGCHVGQDARDTGMVLWGQIGMSSIGTRRASACSRNLQ